MSELKTGVGNGVATATLARSVATLHSTAEQDNRRTVSDEEAHKYQSRLFAMAIFLTGDYHDASDLAQEVWLRILRYRVCLPERSTHAIGLLAAMTRNAYCDELNRRRPGFSLSPENEPATENDDAERADQLRWINTLISTLPIPELVVVRLRLRGDLTLEGVAETLGIPFGTAKKRYYRAIRRLLDRVPAQLR